MFILAILTLFMFYLATNYFVALQFSMIFPRFSIVSYSVIALLTLTSFYIALGITLLLFGYGAWHAKQIKLTS